MRKTQTKEKTAPSKNDAGKLGAHMQRMKLDHICHPVQKSVANE